MREQEGYDGLDLVVVLAWAAVVGLGATLVALLMAGWLA